MQKAPFKAFNYSSHIGQHVARRTETTGKIKFIAAAEFCGVISLSLSWTKERIIILLAQTKILFAFL